MKLHLVVAVLFGVAAAEVAKFTKCDESSDDVCEVTEVRINPCKNVNYCKLKKGEESSMQIDFIPKFEADKLTTSLFGVISNSDVPFDEFSDVDACQYTGCPTQPGQKQQLEYKLTLSKKLPNGRYTFKWKLWNADDKTKMCCFKTEVQLRK